MTNYLAELAGLEASAIIWFSVAAMLFFAEAVVPGVFFLWFGLAAVIIGILAVVTDLNLVAQVGLFAILAFANVIFARMVVGYGKNAPSDTPTLNTGGNRYVGRQFRVAQAIVAGRGRIKVGDSIWTAEGPDTAAGAMVEVVEARGTILVVKPVALD
ncbi:MAG: NfeD family protein [Pseudomonadota bacterium]